MLTLDHPFEVFHLYDPSIWFSNGEVTQRLQQLGPKTPATVYVTYQPEPAFHRQKIEALIQVLETHPDLTLMQQFYPKLSHNALFIDSFYKGIQKTHGTAP